MVIMNREFLQLAHTFKNHNIGGWYVSEKLDGMRAYWDGGVTRGQLTSTIKFANTAKDYRRVTPPRATGLWTRYAKPIAAPDWFLDKLPENVPLDGELHLDNFQELMSVVKRIQPDERWESVQYYVFDSPSDYHMFAPGRINNPQWTIELEDLRNDFTPGRANPIQFWKLEAALEKRGVNFNNKIKLHHQLKLPNIQQKAIEEMYCLLDTVTSKGGEGLMLRNPESIWIPKRSPDILKVKPMHDAEATIVGYKWGVGKLEGLMGSLCVEWENNSKKVLFDLSGFTDLERVLFTDGDEVLNPKFPIGKMVSFKYRELTNDGVPKEARYYRR